MTEKFSKYCLQLRFYKPSRVPLAAYLLAFIAPLHAADFSSFTSIAEAWWFLPLLLGIFCYFIGVLAVFAGIGGGVLFVPLTSALFPFHLDFIRGTGLLIALAGALAASPALLKNNLASLRVGLPAAFVASTFSIVGARLGLALPVYIVQLSLGVLILGVAVLIFSAKNSDHPLIEKPDFLGAAFGMHGIFTDPATKQSKAWQTHRTVQGLFFFAFIGVIAGMFGLGAGWANVPVFNLLMGLPFKMAVATSSFSLSIVDASAVWVYIHEDGILPLMAIPAVLGLMSGSLTGVHFMMKSRPKIIRLVVIIMLAVAGARSLYSGFAPFLH